MVRKLPLRSEKEFEKRKEEFGNLILIDIKVAEKNYKQYEDREITQQEICNMLEINEKEAKTLYHNSVEDSLFVMMETIVYSCLKTITKIQKCLQFISYKPTIAIKEFLHLLLFIKGKDKTLEKKMMAILKSKKIKVEEEMNKVEAVELIK